MLCNIEYHIESVQDHLRSTCTCLYGETWVFRINLLLLDLSQAEHLSY